MKTNKAVKLEDTMAFWSYDLFPFFQGGHAVSTDTDGRYFIAELCGYVKPKFVTNVFDGEKLLKDLAVLTEARRKEIEEINMHYNVKAATQTSGTKRRNIP